MDSPLVSPDTHKGKPEAGFSAELIIAAVVGKDGVARTGLRDGIVNGSMHSKTPVPKGLGRPEAQGQGR